MIKETTHEGVSKTIYDLNDAGERREIVVLRFSIDDGKTAATTVETSNAELYTEHKKEIDTSVAAFRAMAVDKAAAAGVVML